MEQSRRGANRVPTQGPGEDQAPGKALRAGQSPDGNRVPRAFDFCRLHAASIDLDGNRLGDRHMRLSFRSDRISGMDFARNVAASDTVNPCLRRTLAQKSHGSNPAASDLDLFVTRLDYFLCGTYRCELGNHRAGRKGSSHGLGGVAGCLRAHAAPGDLVRDDLARAPQTGGTERSEENYGGNGRKKLAV